MKIRSLLLACAAVAGLAMFGGVALASSVHDGGGGESYSLHNNDMDMFNYFDDDDNAGMVFRLTAPATDSIRLVSGICVFAFGGDGGGDSPEQEPTPNPPADPPAGGDDGGGGDIKAGDGFCSMRVPIRT